MAARRRWCAGVSWKASPRGRCIWSAMRTRAIELNRFAELLDRLVLTPSRNGKLTLLVDYFRSVEDPDRGLAPAAITGDLNIAAVKPAMLRTLVTERMDPVLFGYSYDYVGDLAETVSLVWPQTPGHIPNREPTLGDVVAK